VRRFAPLIPAGGRVLDLAAGAGRHARLLLDMGFMVEAVDREVVALLPLTGPRCTVRAIDLETGDAWPLGGGYQGIVVTNYLYRPLLPAIVAAVGEGGVLIYETFMLGNERFGRPRNPEFLLHPGELLDACVGLTVAAFEQGEVTAPRPAMMQRIAAINGAVGRLPYGRYSAASGRGARSGGAKLRSCCNDGTMRRASAMRPGSICAVTIPSRSPPSASTSPHGSTINEWP